MAGRLEGKNAVVIGAGSAGPGWGKGKGTAVQFAREGARVVCGDVNEGGAQETAAIILTEGGKAEAIRADATNSSETKAAIELCVAAYGSINILHNNVGIVVNGGVVELSEEEWDRAFDINLKSCYLSMKHAIPHMVAQGGGAIVNVSSISSIRYLTSPYVSYYASKAAMNHMTRVTAAEYASRQVRINTILPGLMDTPMADISARARGLKDEDKEAAWKARAARVPMGWMGDGWDIARAAVFLASDEARFITGAELVVDGGLTLKS